MGIADFFSDLYDSLPSWTEEVHAEAPSEEEEEKDDSEEKSEDTGDDAEKEEGGDDAQEGEDAEEEEEEEEEDEEEDEPVDPKPQLEEECARSAQCLPYKHHYQECVERVTAQQEDEDHKGPHEDCVEEFFHLQHCATQCAAPKLFKLLK